MTDQEKNEIIELKQLLEKVLQQTQSTHEYCTQLSTQINTQHRKILKRQHNLHHLFLNSFLMNKLLRRFRPKLGQLYHHAPKNIEIPSSYHQAIELPHYPTISIVTPAFNHAHFIEKTIKSVLDQKYPNLEYIVKDGGSTDNTSEILKRYEPKLAHWESTKDFGQSQAINIGFSHAHGEIMAYLNSDDLLLPGTLHYVADYFNKHPEVDVVYGHRILIDKNDDEIGRWVLPPHQDKILTWADYIPQETLFWRRSLWNKVDARIDESFQFAMDWDLILRFISVGAHFVRLPRFLGAFRVHPHQKSSANISNMGKKDMKRLLERCHGRTVNPQEIHRRLRFYYWHHIILHKCYRLGLLKY